MSEITIRTNNVPRFTIDAWEFTEKDRKEFDYLDWKGIDEGTDSATFFRYKGQLYDMNEFMRCNNLPADNPLSKWHGYYADSFFSGIVIKFPDKDYDSIIVAQYFC